jgi:carbonic anhydrase
MKTGLRWDLGIGRLRGDWAAMLRPADLRADLVAATSVALLAIPLSLAIALASGVPPAAGLASAIVAGVVAAWFGGTPLSVTGPAAAMAVLIMNVVEHHGMGGLLVITLAVGLLQLLMGVLGFGRVALLVPLPVIEGFTAGIGAIILVGQLPRALGLAPPDESHFIDVITHIGDLIHETRAGALIVALSSLAICMLAPRIHARLPGPLLAVALPSVGMYFAGVELETVAAIPRALHFSWPSFDLDFGALISPILMVFALASLESLLSAAAVDKLGRGAARHDPDQEFIGQGLANAASALFGGIPVTGVIARSALNVQAGAKTRRAAFLHSVIVLVLVLGAAPLLQAIPVAALAGVLMAVALRMLNPVPLIMLYKSSRADAGVFVVTFALMVALDLIQGVQWGLGAALGVAAIMTTRNRAKMHTFEAAKVHRLVLEGSITFLSAIKFDGLRSEAAQLPRGTSVILDLSEVNNVDASGAEYLVDYANFVLDRGVGVVLLGMDPDIQQRVIAFDHKGRLAERIAETEAEIPRRLPRGHGSTASRLILGVAAYRRKQLPRYQALFQSLAEQQHPHTLFVTCADSRIVPNLITDSDPGELFIMRNVGNMIPAYSEREMPASAAGVEYAVGVLNVKDVVVCAHSRCGAIGALRNPSRVPLHLTSLRAWLSDAGSRKLCRDTPAHVHDDDVARANALLQVDNLRSYALVREREQKGELRLQAWFFDIATGEVDCYDFNMQRWERVGEEPRPPQAANERPAFDPAPAPAPSVA